MLVLSLRLTGFGPNLARGAHTTRSTEALSWRWVPPLFENGAVYPMNAFTQVRMPGQSRGA